MNKTKIERVEFFGVEKFMVTNYRGKEFVSTDEAEAKRIFEASNNIYEKRIKPKYRFYKHAEKDEATGENLPYSVCDYFIDLNYKHRINTDYKAIYCPSTQHGSATKDYIKESIEVTKDEYIEATREFYTPEEYLK